MKEDAKVLGTEKIFCVLDQQENFLRIKSFLKGKCTSIWISEAVFWSRLDCMQSLSGQSSQGASTAQRDWSEEK